MEFTDFSYDGITSHEMGLINISIKGGLFEEPLIASRRITEVVTRGSDKPYFMGINREPLEFELEFAFLHPFDHEAISRVARWLDQDYYREFFFIGNDVEDVRQKRYFCMLESDSSLLHNGLGQGFVTIKMRCNSPFGYSPEYYSIKHDFSLYDGSPIEFQFSNYGDVDLLPEMWIEKIGEGDVRIENMSNGGDFFEMKGLRDREIVYIDNDKQYIISDAPDVHRWDDLSGDFLALTRGVNYLRATGNFFLTFRYRFTLL